MRLVPDSLREAALALGVPAWRTSLVVVLRTARAGHRDRRRCSRSRASPARRRRSSSPRSATASGRRRSTQPIASLPVQIFTYAIIAVRRLARAGLGRRRSCSSRSSSSSTSPRAGSCADAVTSHADDRAPDPPPTDARRRRAVGDARRKMRAESLARGSATSHALEGHHARDRRATVTAIIGPSGCGKSTFIRCLNRMHEVVPGARVEGEVLLDGDDIYGARRRSGRACAAASAWCSSSRTRSRRCRSATTSLAGLRAQRHATARTPTRSSSDACGRPRCGTR